MTDFSNAEMIARAAAVVNRRPIGDFSVGDVGCALLSESGQIYLGVCIDTGSGMGFCAEHSAVAAMVTAGEMRIRKIVAVWKDGEAVYVLSPCGRCREFMHQIDKANLQADVILDHDKVVKLIDLLPYHDWFKKSQTG